MNRLTMMAGTLIWYAGGCSVAFDLAMESDSIESLFDNGVAEYGAFCIGAARTLYLIHADERHHLRLQELGEARVAEIKEQFIKRVLELPLRETVAAMFCFFIGSLSSDQERDIRGALACARRLTLEDIRVALNRDNLYFAEAHLDRFWREYHGTTPD